MTDTVDRKVDAFYKFIQPVLTTLTAIAVVAVLTMIIKNDRQQAIMQVKLEAVQKQLDFMQDATKDRYTNKNADSDFQIRDQLIRTLEKEDERIEKRIDRIEQRVQN